MDKPPKSIIQQPELQVYIEDFGKADDCYGAYERYGWTFIA